MTGIHRPPTGPQDEDVGLNKVSLSKISVTLSIDAYMYTPVCITYFYSYKYTLLESYEM
jgi:hypothetical protein